MPLVRGIVSVDVETDRLHGHIPFAIAAVVRDGGKTIKEFQGRTHTPALVSDWVNQNIVHVVENMPLTHDTVFELEEDFWDFWVRNRQGRDCIAYFGNQGGEAALFNRLILRKYEERWNLPPSPLHEVCTLMRARGWDDIHHIEKYMGEHDLEPDCSGPRRFHNPLFDAHAAALVWEHLMS